MEYYKRKYVIYEILKNCRDRDFSALGKGNANIRALKVRCIFDFNRVLKLINWDKNKQNFYVSCARLKEIPEFTFNPRKRSSETREWFRNEYDKQIVSYDLFFDFDKDENDSWDELIKEVKILKEYLDDYEVPYYIVFSGNKGFQIVIDGQYVPIKEIRMGNVYPHKTIVENIKKILNLKFLDLANNGVSSRLRKLPYSLVGNNIALPLSDEQFENFDVKDMNVYEVMRNVRIIRRGNLERFSNLNLNKKIGNTESFIKVFSFK